eukprot:TRINITY_DN2442_c1_g1_i1.p1 TRINITY_DN2442_c1_g1~~TRINITY_DN2442_c1_g1_i1.p1  ORF type:complete len:267 (+),score=46.08 TRINITY_DN2442_c1_g1_i1:77-802(+)
MGRGGRVTNNCCSSWLELRCSPTVRPQCLSVLPSLSDAAFGVPPAKLRPQRADKYAPAASPTHHDQIALQPLPEKPHSAPHSSTPSSSSDAVVEGAAHKLRRAVSTSRAEGAVRRAASLSKRRCGSAGAGSVLMIGSRPGVPLRSGARSPSPPHSPPPRDHYSTPGLPLPPRSEWNKAPDILMAVTGAEGPLRKRRKPPVPMATHGVAPGGWLAGYGGRWTDNILFNARQTQVLRTRSANS